MKPEIVRTVAELREPIASWRRDHASVGMVPTMGALHRGHIELVSAALAQNDRVVVTLFVNPTQFAAHEDLGSYPRTEGQDRLKLEELGPDILFAPAVAEMYPPGFATTLTVGGPAIGLESDFRPHFFSGVATVVAKLLLAGLPDRAYFGEKDYQQLLVVRQLVRDLNIPTEIVGCPTVREEDGLALSSRNAYLSQEDREVAPVLYRTLRDIAEALRQGKSVSTALANGRANLVQAGFLPEYLELRDGNTLGSATDQTQTRRLLTAVRLGTTRLIDNIEV